MLWSLVNDSSQKRKCRCLLDIGKGTQFCSLCEIWPLKSKKFPLFPTRHSWQASKSLKTRRVVKAVGKRRFWKTAGGVYIGWVSGGQFSNSITCLLFQQFWVLNFWSCQPNGGEVAFWLFFFYEKWDWIFLYMFVGNFCLLSPFNQ